MTDSLPDLSETLATGFALSLHERYRVLLESLAAREPARAAAAVADLPGGRVRIALKRAWSDGTTALELSRLELVERLVSLVPPPRANQVHTRCGAARGAGVSVAASGSGTAEGAQGEEASGECGEAAVEAWARRLS